MSKHIREVFWQGRRFEVDCARKSIRGFRLRVLTGGRVRLSIPCWADELTVSRFLDSKAGWIAKTCDRMPNAMDAGGVAADGFGMPKRVKLRGLWIGINADPGSRPVRIEGDAIILGTKGCQTAAGVSARLNAWLKAQAKEDFDWLLDRNDSLLARMGSARPEICIRDMRTLWGSCRPKKGSITLNLRLIHESPAFTEYVMLHEIAHLRHPGHGAGFAAFMDSNMPDWRGRRKLARIPASDT